ncbi:PP2C family protein-serine/threonine phosphatase [Streptomyces mangrovisoli]|uniref:Protein phosphatase n=1 Tax=Streptomyces mangrovisoli TaxID=1428628 RepID=A0A1J4P533_9ACTN|nr:PP2C family protein-serine/threonine phosphatase [Streptomyces mangrovisoli]OIJ68844.1 protein phosphatase [Streptomyces mangrovisoli]
MTSDPAAPAETAPAPEPDGDSEALELLGKALLRADSPQALAHCLLEHLAPAVRADAVLLYRRPPAGGLALIGRAGVDGTLAAQWRQVPPVSGIAASEALDAHEPRWLEHLDEDRKRYHLITDPRQHWRSRAWLPLSLSSGDHASVALGVLRACDGPFTPRQRDFLRAVARLCAGRLRALDLPGDDKADEVPGDDKADEAPGADRAGEVPGDVQAVFDALPGAVILMTPLRAESGEVEDYRIDSATAQAVDILGRTGRELVGLRILECHPTLAGEPLWRGCLHTLATGEPYAGEPFAYHEVVDGVPRTATYSVRATRLGERLVVTWLRHDHADLLEQRLSDVQRLANLGWAGWNLATGEITWSPQVFTVFDRDPADGPLPLERLPELVLPDDAPALSRAVTALVRDGKPFDMPIRIRAVNGVRHLRAVAEAVSDATGTPVEVHGFVQNLTTLRRAELALVESERAILTQHGVLQAERALAARLQHALLPLPSRPVRLAGLRVEVAYLPAQSGVHVGGDWFSAIELPSDEALFVVGDVAGHGVDAVATMAQLRFTAKGMVITGSSLTGALDRLNRLLLHSRDTHATATLVMARYSPAERRLVWAQAGHPPPLLLRRGRARFLDRPTGMLLGACAEPRFKEAECLLEPGDRVLLYTDGLVERPGEGLDIGLARLTEAVVAERDAGPAPMAALLSALLEGERRDDVCVLDIRVPEESAAAPAP